MDFDTAQECDDPNLLLQEFENSPCASKTSRAKEVEVRFKEIECCLQQLLLEVYFFVSINIS